MPTPSSTPSSSKKTARPEPPDSFDVTQVIGTVQINRYGDGESPHLAAFRLIAEHDNPGTFTFPNLFGADTTVTVNAPDSTSTYSDDDA